MSRSDRIYDKPPLLIEEMIALLESRNLYIPDRDKARHYLRYINYYRLSGYGYLFEEDHSNGRSHRFRDGVSFDDLLALYVFDRHLRLLLMDAIERIEVGVRTVMAYELSHKYGAGNWMLDPVIFEETADFTHAELIRIIKRETASSAEEGSDRHVRREPFLNHYFSHYDAPELPPAWILSEVLSLGTWSRVFANLKQSKDRKRISRVFDLAPDTLKSWLHSLTYLRNLCAHHSRIYGRSLAFPPAMLGNWPPMAASFCRYIAVLEHLLRKVAPDTNWGARVKQLIETEARIDHSLLGIQDDQFWNAVLNPDVGCAPRH